MAIDPLILAEAYAVYAEFGPALKTPRRDRLRAQFSGLDEAELDAVLLTMERVSATVWALARRGGGTKGGDGLIEKMLREAHPFLTGAGLSRAAFLVNYYAWHEGWTG
jgi:hypothetical protein